MYSAIMYAMLTHITLRIPYDDITVAARSTIPSEYEHSREEVPERFTRFPL